MRSLKQAPNRPRRGGTMSRDRASASTEVLGAGKAYEAASHSGTFMGRWPAQLRSPDAEWFPSRGATVGRARDAVRNDPIARSAVDRKKNAAIGRGWRFSSKPNARALGISTQAARELGQVINTEWHLYANSYNFLTDAERKLNFGQQLRVVASHLMVDGEFLAQAAYAANDEGARYKTRLKLIDPDRLSNPMGQMDSDRLRGGVEMDEDGVAVAYQIREKHPSDIGFSAKMFSWVRHPRYSTPLGRPNILHGFDPDRAGQTRGVPKFASVLKAFRGFGKFTDATIQAATINALILGYIKSNSGFKAVGDSFSVDDLVKYDDDRHSHYKDSPVEMGDAVLPTLAYDDEISLATASKDVTSFDSFIRAIIRLIAAALGVTYEELSMDYSQTNYSSARAAMIHAWADTVAFMGTIEAHLVRPFFVAWLEEAFDNGRIEIPAGAPDFYDAIDAYAAGRWLGPGRGYIDPVKEILAAATRIETGVSTLEDECAEQGKDYEEVMEQQAYEREMRIERGLPVDADPNSASVVNDAPQNHPDTPAPADRKPGSATAQARAMVSSPDYDASLDARPTIAKAS